MLRQPTQHNPPPWLHIHTALYTVRAWKYLRHCRVPLTFRFFSIVKMEYTIGKMCKISGQPPGPSLILQHFAFSVYGSSCNSLFFYLILSFSALFSLFLPYSLFFCLILSFLSLFLYFMVFHPAMGIPITVLDRECKRATIRPKRENYMNCRKQKIYY